MGSPPSAVSVSACSARSAMTRTRGSPCAERDVVHKGTKMPPGAGGGLPADEPLPGDAADSNSATALALVYSAARSSVLIRGAVGPLRHVSGRRSNRRIRFRRPAMDRCGAECGAHCVPSGAHQRNHLLAAVHSAGIGTGPIISYASELRGLGYQGMVARMSALSDASLRKRMEAPPDVHPLGSAVVPGHMHDATKRRSAHWACYRCHRKIELVGNNRIGGGCSPHGMVCSVPVRLWCRDPYCAFLQLRQTGNCSYVGLKGGSGGQMSDSSIRTATSWSSLRFMQPWENMVDKYNQASWLVEQCLEP
eukprot:365255-Chlamydomonas_euryale.AAC.6